MIIVHDIFVCKPGNAGKAAKMIKESMGKNPNVVHVMTDMTGQYHRVIMVTQYKNLAEYEKSFEAYKNPSPEMKESMKQMAGFQNMYLTGSREIYQSW